MITQAQKRNPQHSRQNPIQPESPQHHHPLDTEKNSEIHRREERREKREERRRRREINRINQWIDFSGVRTGETRGSHTAAARCFGCCGAAAPPSPHPSLSVLILATPTKQCCTSSIAGGKLSRRKKTTILCGTAWAGDSGNPTTSTGQCTSLR